MGIQKTQNKPMETTPYDKCQNLIKNKLAALSDDWKKTRSSVCYSCKLSRGEICVANFKVPLRMVRVWTCFYNSQLGHLCKLGDYS